MPEKDNDLDLKERLAALDVRLQNQHKEAAENGPMLGAVKLDAKALRASRIGMELLVAIGGGLGLGWLIDQWLETLPAFMLVFAFVGFGAGILNVWRLMNDREGKVGFKE